VSDLAQRTHLVSDEVFRLLIHYHHCLSVVLVVVVVCYENKLVVVVVDGDCDAVGDVGDVAVCLRVAALAFSLAMSALGHRVGVEIQTEQVNSMFLHVFLESMDDVDGDDDVRDHPHHDHEMICFFCDDDDDDDGRRCCGFDDVDDDDVYYYYGGVPDHDGRSFFAFRHYRHQYEHEYEHVTVFVFFVTSSVFEFL
jgi:hypothetical protein